MTLRAILSPWPSRKVLRAWALGLILALPLVAVLGASPAAALVLSVEVAPASPTACDSVALIVKGVLHNSCYKLLRVRLGEMRLLPVMGPLPRYEVPVRIVVQEPNPNVDMACPEATQPYEQKLYLPFHPPGSYLARATEYLVPYSPDSTAAPIDTSRVETSFVVQPDSCPTPGCYLLGFNHGALCNFGSPGGTVCVDVTLGGLAPVAGIQSVIHAVDPKLDAQVPGSVLHPISVEAIGDAEGFQVNWTAEESTVRFLLYSTEGKTLPRKSDRMLRVCYAIGSGTPPSRYALRFGRTVVSDPRGNAIPACPTFAEEVGRICVGDGGGCDLDGNGRSNVLDVIRLARCALNPGACPDSIAGRADCNDDGTVDVRDIVCCVRSILTFTRPGSSTVPIDPSVEPTRIRFVGVPQWLTPESGRVEIEIDPGSDFGAVMVEVGAAQGTQIDHFEQDYGNVVDPGFSPNPTYSLQYEVGDGQHSQFLVMRASRDAIPTEPFRVFAFFRGVGSMERAGAFQIGGAEAGSWVEAAPAAAEITQGTTAVPDLVPRVYPARPNPFTDATDISYEIPAPKHVTLRVYSVTGKLVRTLVDTTMPAGVHRAPWNGRDSAGRVVSSGIYFVKLSDGTAESTIRIMRLK